MKLHAKDNDNEYFHSNKTNATGMQMRESLSSVPWGNLAAPNIKVGFDSATAGTALHVRTCTMSLQPIKLLFFNI